MSIRHIFITIMAVAALSSYGQCVLTEKANSLRNSDRITYVKMEPCSPGANGENAVWNFSTVHDLCKNYNVSITRDTLGLFHKIEGNEKCSLHIEADTLKQFSMQNRLTKIFFHNEMLVMKYPMQYGDSLSAPFEGYGIYCSDHTIRERGQVTLHADGWGTLILSDRDTICNALRVCTLTTKVMAMDARWAEVDSTNLKQEIEEKYEWYCRGFRYPIYDSTLKSGLN